QAWRVVSRSWLGKSQSASRHESGYQTSSGPRPFRSNCLAYRSFNRAYVSTSPGPLSSRIRTILANRRANPLGRTPLNLVVRDLDDDLRSDVEAPSLLGSR